MDVNKMAISDTGLFVCGDVSLNYFRNNGIETVGQLLAIGDVSILIGKRPRSYTYDNLKAIVGLARYKYLGETMDATNWLDETFDFDDVRYEKLNKKERKNFASLYFKSFGFRSIDSMFMFWHLRAKLDPGVKLIDAFKIMYEDTIGSGSCCLTNILELYISDYSSKKQDSKNREYVKINGTYSE